MMDVDQHKLTPSEFDRCSQAYNEVVQRAGCSGKIDSPWMMKNLMQTLGLNPSNQYVTDAFARYSKAESGTIEYSDFIALMENEKKQSAAPPAPDEDIVEAFMSLGGNEDRSGEVSMDDFKNTIAEFGLSLNVDDMISSTLGRSSKDAMLNYADFSRLFRKIFDLPEAPPPAPPKVTVPDALSSLPNLTGRRLSKADFLARFTARGVGGVLASGLASARAREQLTQRKK